MIFCFDSNNHRAEKSENLPVLLGICGARDQGRNVSQKEIKLFFSLLYVLFLAVNTATPVLVSLTCSSQRASHLFYMVNRKWHHT